MANNTHPENQEIDLSKLSKKVKAFFSRTNDSMFDVILFIRRNIIMLAALLIVGVGLGFLMDHTTKVYEHKAFVIPNFQSVDYLYSKVDEINSKIKEEDTVFLKTIGVKNAKKFTKIEIEPVVDIYDFISSSDEKRLELFKILAENGDLAKILEENTTSKNYRNHLITITTKKSAKRADLIDPILHYLNSSKYFDTIKKQALENQRIRLVEIDSIIKQIDAILDEYGKSNPAKGGSLVYYRDNSNLNEVITTKNNLIKEQEYNKIELINYQKVIKDSSVMMNIKNFSSTTGRMKFIIPIVLILCFISLRAFRSYYKKQINKRALPPAN